MKALAIASLLALLFVSAWMGRYALRPSTRTRRAAAIRQAYALACLLGTGKYGYDIAAHWRLLGDDSTAIAALNLLSLMMIDAIALLPAAFAPVVFPDAFRAVAAAAAPANNGDGGN